jgi:hypothetical protein
VAVLQALQEPLVLFEPAGQLAPKHLDERIWARARHIEVLSPRIL